MKLTLQELESEITLTKSMPAKERAARLETLKSAEVVEVDKDDGKETPIKISIVEAKGEESPQDKAADDDKGKTKAKDDEADDADEKDVEKKVTKALDEYRKEHPTRAKFFINNIVGGDKLVIPKSVRRHKPKYFQDYEGQDRSAAERAYCLGMWAIAIATGSKRAKAFCEEQGYTLDASGDEEDGFRTKASAHNEGVNTVGGFLVPPDIDQDLIDLREQFGLFRGWARSVPMFADTKDRRRRTGGLTAAFVGEQGTTQPSRKTWDMVKLTAKKLMCLTTFTNELREDAAINIGDDLAREIAYAFANKEDDCGFNGDGTSTYGSIVGVIPKLTNLNGVDDGGGIVLGSGSTWATLALVDFQNMVARIPQFADTANCAFYCHRTFWASVMNRLELAAGGVTSTEIINGVRTPIFLGYPVRLTQIMRSATASGTVPCLFGDLAMACDYGDRRSTTIAFSEHATVDGVSVFETDEIAIRGTERFDINVHDIGTTTVGGPIVGLATQ